MKSKLPPEQEWEAPRGWLSSWLCLFLGLSRLGPPGDEFLTSQFWEHMSWLRFINLPLPAPLMSDFNFAASRVTLSREEV